LLTTRSGLEWPVPIQSFKEVEMVTLRSHILAVAAAGLLSVSMGIVGALADDTVVAPGTTTEVPSAAAAEPAAPEAATGATASEVAPNSGTGTAEEPAYSITPSEGPGGGCHHGRMAEEPSV
jgi:hypothetical protein